IGALELFGPNPNGCPRCKEGYKGRFAILETLYLEQELKTMVVRRASAVEIKTAAIKLGMITLRRVGLLNAARGRTSLEEVLRTTLGDD
ncbi:MAG: type IV-A pilus assembly ATPase PilB, partial [Planctomycetota bacterium]|nr:type IV-A pilus assembly ATPase PilB [Planctomycetota bacterium]